MSSKDSAQHQIPASQAGFFARAGQRARQFLCGLHGHDALLHFEHGRISLLCSSCGHESPGWEVKGIRQTTPAGAKPRVMQMPLVDQRRVA